MMTVQSDHRWPTDPGGHMWTKWMDKRAREGARPPTQYRMCVHPECSASEDRKAPQA